MAPTPANIKYAHRLAAEIRDRIRHGSFRIDDYFPASGTTPNACTIGHQLNTWLSAQRIEASTKAGYASAIRFWGTALADDTNRPVGGLLLPSLRTSHILHALAQRPDLTGKTVNNYVSVLREALELAITDGNLANNPASSIKRAKHQKEPPDPFSREEAEAIIQHFADRHAGQAANMIEFWFWTGLRTSEISALAWRNVDLASGTILIAKASVRGQIKDTKTNTVRHVRLNSRALAAIQAQRQHTMLADGAVFLDPRYGTPWHEERAFRRSFWTPTLKVLGIRYRRPYQCRHTYATMMLMAGMTPAYCAKQLGHSVEMFLRTYSKWIDGAQNDLEMARLETAISSPVLPQKTTTRT